MDNVLGLLQRYKYLAMFGILCLCGLGLPIPEELTLLAGGFAVGWEWADYFPSCLWCTAGILAGDSITFWIGRHFGARFFASRSVRLVLSTKRQARVRKAFSDHGNKTVFFARFVSGLRIGVYAYAGKHGMAWRRFVLLDFLGCLLSVPLTVFIGKFVAEELADPKKAADYAHKLLREGYTWLYYLLGVVLLSFVTHFVWNRFVYRRAGLKLPEEPGPPSARHDHEDTSRAAGENSKTVPHRETADQSANE